MIPRFDNQTVVIVGASGGLGSAFARAFSLHGARLLLAGRQQDRLLTLASELGPQVCTAMVDVTDPDSIHKFAECAQQQFGRVDVVVNATGVDVRKAFWQHTLADIQNTLDINLMGAMILTHAFLPVMQQAGGVFVLVGGFADGRLAFPFYSADVASRAALFSFAESLNRELAGSGPTISYFCPMAADTEAERPFHPIWREMKVGIVSPERVAAELLDTVEKRKTVHIMGGISTNWFAKLNAVWPQLADLLILRRYKRILQRHLDVPSLYRH